MNNDVKPVRVQRIIPDNAKCAECNNTVPMPISGRVEQIDYCIADIVAALNAAKILTVMSCCGHGRDPGWISLFDGRRVQVMVEVTE